MKKLPLFFTTALLLLVLFVQPVNAQTSTGSGTTLPETGIETPLLIISGAGLTLFSGGLLFKKLQHLSR